MDCEQKLTKIQDMISEKVEHARAQSFSWAEIGNRAINPIDRSSAFRTMDVWILLKEEYQSLLDRVAEVVGA